MPDLPLSPLTSISPADGRYADKVSELRGFFSEYALTRRRVRVEIEWVRFLAQSALLAELPPLPPRCIQKLEAMLENFDLKQAQAVKTIEQQTNHDVKAVEYYLREQFKKDTALSEIASFIHFGCTSEDINNLAWALSLSEARDEVLLPCLREILSLLSDMSVRYAPLAMPARTHGQIASPTTAGKEFANYAARLQRQLNAFEQIEITAKFNGAVGNYNAHQSSCPEVDWPVASHRFIASFGLKPLRYTTQIEPHDSLAELLDALARINRILLDLCRDVWGYVALDYFTQRPVVTETGSSTMPHKINPIDFENAEGNIGIANAVAHHLSEKLPVSRWQRDLSDSTAMRCVGLSFAHTLIALKSLKKGLGKIDVNPHRLADELERHWELLAEAIQTVMRRHGIEDGYEQLKALTRGKAVKQEDVIAFIKNLKLPDAVKQSLLETTPSNYIGLAEKLASDVKRYLQDP